MELHLDDDAFVRAPVALVYRRLTDIGAWDGWWPGMGVAPWDHPDGVEAWHFRLRAGRGRRLRFRGVPGAWRHDAGFRVEVTGDLEGWTEFWLEEGWGGTVVHHLVVAATPRRAPLRVLRDYRTVFRRGLWQLKDDLQTDVRTAAGLHP
jgi:hypothetical protein